MTEDNDTTANTEEIAAADESAAAPPHDDPETDGTVTTAEAARALAELGRLVCGQVTLSFPERDVVWPMDWAAAQRLLAIYARRRRGISGDTLNAASDPFAAWMVVDTDTVLAMAWSPGTPVRPDRTILDPQPLTAPST